MMITLPNEVEYIINALESEGFEAYAVGGCVRDSLLGKSPQDWDVCTSALPEQTMSCFAGQHIIETGLKHGTVTLMFNHKPFEITTYRADRKHTDKRHPGNAKFVNVLKRDLARRDFTISAMAYNQKTGLVDYYSGQQDLSERRIKCVGNADKRFQEDALRIMRALRFASALGFDIDGDTANAMRNNRKLMSNIATERIAAELNKMLMGDSVHELLSAHISVLTQTIPEFEPAIGFEQNNPYHCYDVMSHILFSVDAAPKDLVIRLTMLLHDIAKPSCYTESDDGIGHFYGHPQAGSEMAEKILTRLKYDNDTIKTVTQLILYHDADIEPRRKHIKRWLNRIGEERLRQLLVIKRADAMAQSDMYRQSKLDALDAASPLIDEIIEQRQCFSLKDMAVNGRDLIDAGIPQGIKIGIVLNRLIDMVIDEKVENDKIALLALAHKIRDDEQSLKLS